MSVILVCSNLEVAYKLEYLTFKVKFKKLSYSLAGFFSFFSFLAAEHVDIGPE